MGTYLGNYATTTFKNIHSGVVSVKQVSSVQSHAWNVEYDFTDAKLMRSGGV